MSTTIRWPDGVKFGKGLRQDHDVELLMTSAEATAASRPAAPPPATALPPLTGSAFFGGGVSDAMAQQQQLQPTTMNFAQCQLPLESSPPSSEAPVQSPSHGFGQRGPNPPAVSVAGRLGGATPRVSSGSFRPVLTRLGPAPRRTTAAACRLSFTQPGATGRIVGSAGFKYI